MKKLILILVLLPILIIFSCGNIMHGVFYKHNIKRYSRIMIETNPVMCSVVNKELFKKYTKYADWRLAEYIDTIPITLVDYFIYQGMMYKEGSYLLYKKDTSEITFYILDADKTESKDLKNYRLIKVEYIAFRGLIKELQ